MKKKVISTLLMSVMTVGLLVGSGSNGAVDTVLADGDKTKIRVYVGGDNADLNAQLVEDFNAQSANSEAEIVTLTDGQSGYQMLTVMYNSNSAPNVFFLEAGDIRNLQDKLADVSDMECLQHALDGTVDDVTYDGKVLGVPVKTQAYGIIYNKTALEELLGNDFDVDSLNTLAEFTEVCDKLEEKDIAPTVISPYNWSLGNHYCTKPLARRLALST